MIVERAWCVIEICHKLRGDRDGIVLRGVYEDSLKGGAQEHYERLRNAARVTGKETLYSFEFREQLMYYESEWVELVGVERKGLTKVGRIFRKDRHALIDVDGRTFRKVYDERGVLTYCEVLDGK